MARTFGFDVETSKLPYIYPWQDQSFLVAVGLATESGWRKSWVFNHNEDQLYSVTRYKGEETIARYENQREMIDNIQWVINKADRLVGHNLKFDINWLTALGIDFEHCKLWCTQVTEYLLRGQRLGHLSLHDLSKDYLKVSKIDMVKHFWNSGYETNEIPLRVLIPYLEQDCINALGIYQKQVPKIQAEGMARLLRVQNENSRVLAEIEYNGMKLDKTVAETHYKILSENLAHVHAELLLLFDFDCNFGSNDELSAALYGGVIKRERYEDYVFYYKNRPESALKQRKVVDEIQIPGIGFIPDPRSETKKSGVFSVDKNTIKFLKSHNKEQREVKKLLLEMSKLTKALETFRGKDETKGILNKVGSDGLIHPKYNMTVAKTGRLSSSDPNGQNIPRKGTSPIKKSIVARLEGILGVDLSQIEWRIAAVLCQDPVMIKEILDGVDPHRENAISIFGADPNDEKKFDELRTIAKIVTFRLLYGGTALGFYYDNQMPRWSKKQWQQVVEKFWEKYRGLAKWQADNMNKVVKSNGVLVNPTGRKFIFHLTEKGEYKPSQVKNFPVQSLATADVMPLAMVIIYKKYRKLKKQGLKSLIIGQVHDSLLFDCLDSEYKLLAKMCIEVFEELPKYIEELWGIKVNVPLTGDAEYGPTWGDQVKFKLAA